MNERIFLSPPHMGGQEQAFVEDAFSSNWIAPVGPNITGLESDICKFTKADYCVAVSSGTAAIHLALMILGVSEGDEVMAPTFTFSASINPIIYLKATPILVGSEKDTWNMCPDLLEQALQDRLKKGKHVKAILVVHLYGMPAKMEAITEIAHRYNIPIIEDAAEALGSEYKKQKLGTIGDIGIFSFNGNKIITTSGGGALISNEQKHVDKAKHLASQAKEDVPHYEHKEIGYNYAMSNVSAGIGRGQFLVLENRVEKRRDIFNFYLDSLSKIPGVTFPMEPSTDYYSNRWITIVLIDSKILKHLSREGLRLELESSNIESRPVWKPMHEQPVFEHLPYYGDSLASDVFRNGLCLPSGSGLNNAQLTRIVDIITNYCK